ncbi:MAG TPA: HAD hydrolase-like protein [Myxococcaceae bacterium]|nr:HAD hydrolase-like protein [Myxococcaceae bacterium]
MTVRNVLFDLDGTLTDSGEGICTSLTLAFREAGLPAPEPTTLQGIIGLPLRDALRDRLGLSTAQMEQVVPLYRAHYAATGVSQGRVYPGIEPLLQMLRDEGARLFVATAKIRPAALAVLDHFGLLPFFHGVYACTFDGRTATKPEMVEDLLLEEGLAPDATAIIGDHAQDMRSARRNGLKGIGVLWGYGSRESLLAAGADALVESPQDLPPHLGLRNGARVGNLLSHTLR